jgi:hypothetical protein
MLGCEPNPWKAGADFKQFVRGGPSPQPGAAATNPGNALPPVTPVAPPRAQSNPPVQPMPRALEAQPGQSGQTLTPE